MILSRKFAAHLTLASAVVLLATVQMVGAQKDATAEPTESDNTILGLPILADGEALDLTFEGSDGAILAAFNASEGDEVSISMIAIDNLDPYIVLFGSDALLLGQDDDSGEESLDSYIEAFEVPEDGTYFILATTFPNRNFGMTDDSDVEFTLLVEGNTQPADFDADVFSYRSVSATVGDAIDLYIDETAPTYFVTFDGLEGQEVALNAPSDDLDTLMMLFDSLGSRIAVDDDGGNAPLASLIETELPTDGIYFAIVTTYDFASIATGDTDVTEGIIEFTIEEQ